MLSFLQIIDDAFTQLKQVKGRDTFWDEDEVKNALNDAYWEIALERKCFMEEAVIEVIANVRRYKLPENYVLGSLTRVEFDSERIFPIDIKHLDAYNEDWKAETDSEITHFITGAYPTDEIAVYPLPDTSGDTYNLASESEDYGVITTVGDTSYEEFNSEEGVIVDSTGNVNFEEAQGEGPVQSIRTETNNLKVFYSKFPKRLFRDEEPFLHPLTQNPKKILTKGALSILLAKEGEGKDIQKASFYNKRFNEAMDALDPTNSPVLHRMRSISDASRGRAFQRGMVNLGSNYPSYPS